MEELSFREFMNSDRKGLIKHMKKLLEFMVDEKSAIKSLDYITTCGFIDAYQPDNMDFEEGMRLSLMMIIKSVDYLPVNKIAEYCPKGCSGCFFLNILLFAGMCPSLKSEVKQAFDTFLVNPEYVEMHEIEMFLALSKKQYTRKDDPFPYIGDCLDFDWNSKFVETCVQMGRLCRSESLRKLTINDRRESERLVKKFLTCSSPEEKNELEKELGIEKYY